MSFPDITILENLATLLDTDIYSLLQIEKRKDMNVGKMIEEEKRKIKKHFQKRIFLFLLPLFVITSIIVFKLVPFGYDVMHPRYTHNVNKVLNLGIPKFSFLMKNKEDSYSYKSLRGKSVLKSEMKSYVNTLEHISCNDTAYFYDKDTNTTIIDYSVKGNFLYNTLTYHIRNGNYCSTYEIKEYQKKLGVLNNMRILDKEESSLAILFLPKLSIVDSKNEWEAAFNIYYREGENNKILEKSYGKFEIIEDELIYYRTKIEEHDETVEIPSVSHFVIKETKLILKENYLNEYEKSIILK